MAKEILLYSPIYSFTAADYIEQLEANKDMDITVRMNCPGGDVYAAYGMIAKFAEHNKGKQIKVDGQAKSGGFFMCCYAEDVECLDVSDFLAHRAALPSYIEDNKDYFTDEMKAMLTRINTSLRAGIESKISAKKFKNVTGVSLDDMFSLDNRIDVSITAEQALKMGLVKKVIPLTTEKKDEINALSIINGVAAFSNEPKINNEEKTNTMEIKTLAEFKIAYPGIYAEAHTEGVKAGQGKEKIRVESWLAWSEIDPVAVAKGIEDGSEVDQKVNSQMTVKAVAKAQLIKAEAENTAAIPTADVVATQTEAEKEIAANTARVLKTMGIKPEVKK